MRRRRAAVFALALLIYPAAAQNEPDWVSFFTYQDISFYWSPSSLKREGEARIVKWHDTANPQVVFRSRIDCQARTIRTYSAEEYDLNTGAYYQTTDMPDARTDPIGKPESMGYHLAKAVC